MLVKDEILQNSSMPHSSPVLTHKIFQEVVFVLISFLTTVVMTSPVFYFQHRIDIGSFLNQVTGVAYQTIFLSPKLRGVPVLTMQCKHA